MASRARWPVASSSCSSARSTPVSSSPRSAKSYRGPNIDLAKQKLAEERSGLEDTDIQAVIARLSSQQLSLQAAQAVFARVNENTLFDILR